MKKLIILLLLCTAAVFCLISCGYAFTDLPVVETKEGFSSPSDEYSTNDGNVIYTNGAQIDLYYNASENKKLDDLIRPGASMVKIDDSSILSIEGNLMIPLKIGETYITCKYGKEFVTHPVIVHGGAKSIHSVTVGGISTLDFNGFVGNSYKIELSTSSNLPDIPLSELNVIITMENSYVEQSDIFIMEGNILHLKGIGSFDIHFSSKTNFGDKGVTLRINSSVEDPTLAQAISDWSKKQQLAANGYVTENELARITNLTFNDLVEINDNEWQRILPSLESVTFDLSSGYNSSAKYVIGKGNLSYKFLGSKEKTYRFSISADSRDYLDITLDNIKLQPSGTVLDLSSVKETNIFFCGNVVLRGADATGTKGAYISILANDLTFDLSNDADVEISGGNGIVANDILLQAGNSAINANKLNINAEGNSSHVATITINGGVGMCSIESGGSGGAGGIGIQINQLTCNGYMKCIISGGNGANGNNGLNGPDGRNAYFDNKNTNTAVIHYPTNGQNGQNGGDGGDGGKAHTCDYITVSINTSITFIEGNGGRGGDGGHGGHGGSSENGYYGDMNILGIGGVYFFGVTDGGSGGHGGDGGNGGYKGASNYNNVSGNVTIVRGTVGRGGAGGNGGDGKNGGNAGKGDVPKGTIAISKGTKESGGAGGNAGNGGQGGSGSVPGSGGTRGTRGTGGDGSYLRFDRMWPLSTLEWWGDRGKDGTPGINGSSGTVIN